MSDFQDADEKDEPSVMFACASKILLAGAWLMENGNGRMAMLPYIYATGHWRCEFHPIGKPNKTVFSYTSANSTTYLASHCGGSLRKDVSPEKLARAIWVSVPTDLKEACSGQASPEIIDWVNELRGHIAQGCIPMAFGEDFGRQDVWQLAEASGRVSRLAMPAMPGYVPPGSECSVLDDFDWRKAERQSKRLADQSEFSLSGATLSDDNYIYNVANRLRTAMADATCFEAPRLLRATIAQLHATRIVNSTAATYPREALVSTHPSPDSVVRLATRVLSMIHELHKAGYQRLRMACGWDVNGKNWRVRLVSSSQVADDGWSPLHNSLHTDYSTADGKSYFGWRDATGDDARVLANKFISRSSDLAHRAYGLDWSYAGWFATILGRAERGHLPAFFGGNADQWIDAAPSPLDHSDDHPSTTNYPVISTSELVSSDLPKPGAGYEDVVAFCLGFDGYRGGLLGPDDCWALADSAQRRGLANCGIDVIRTLAFIHQRKLKHDLEIAPISLDHPSMQAIDQVVGEMRRRLA